MFQGIVHIRGWICARPTAKSIRKKVKPLHNTRVHVHSLNRKKHTHTPDCCDSAHMHKCMYAGGVMMIISVSSFNQRRPDLRTASNNHRIVSPSRAHQLWTHHHPIQQRSHPGTQTQRVNQNPPTANTAFEETQEKSGTFDNNNNRERTTSRSIRPLRNPRTQRQV